MAIAISTALRDQIIDGIVNAAAGINFDSGSLEIRTGAAPGPDAADGGTLLADITLPADAFGASSTGTASKAGTWEDTSADAAGTAAHFRIKQTGDAGGATGATDERIEGTVGQGSGDIDLDNTNIAAGQTVTITSFDLTMPAS
jgi:hypothetical protein